MTILIFWVLLFGLVTQQFAVKYGIPYLFLDPEYLDQVGFISFFIIGFAIGGFIMAFNIASYIRNSFRFPFLATLSNPFLKYCVNNSIIPVAFVLIYVISIFSFQSKSEFANLADQFLEVAGFLIGIFLFFFLSLSYFARTNKDIFIMFGIKEDHSRSKIKTKKVYLKDKEWKPLTGRKEDRDWHVETYLSSFSSIRIARGYEHYEKAMLKAVFRQNHKNAAVFQIVAIISLLLVGLLRDYPFFAIPAGASIVLLLTMILMIANAFYSFLRGWTTAVFIVILLSLNFVSQFEPFHIENKAIGLDYDGPRAPYTNQVLENFNNDTAQFRSDFMHTLQILENWKRKNSLNHGNDGKKPRLIFINTSGGGLRSAMWTVKLLHYADSVTNGKLFKNTILITGSSGGMIGASYYRELYLRKLLGVVKEINGEEMTKNISKDLLNPVTLSVATNDMFFRLLKVHDGKYSYTLDRGISLENKINENCNNVFDKRLIDYREPEFNALIPMTIVSPSIMTDGRRLLISPQPISFLTKKSSSKNVDVMSLTECIEFCRMFKKQDAENLKYISALRMSSSFPYISPMVSLPSKPYMEVMDAGVRDNYGINTTIQFMHTFRSWIAENTSGVVIIQIRDRKKEFAIDETPLNTITQTISSPVGSFYDNLFHIQDYNYDQLIKYCNSWFAGKIDVLTFSLKNNDKERISLSWHLTTREKKQVNTSIYEYENQTNLKKLSRLIESD